MGLEDGALEVLDGIRFAVQWRDLLELAGDGIALLGQPTMLLPVVEEEAADGLAGFGEGLAARAGRMPRDQRAVAGVAVGFVGAGNPEVAAGQRGSGVPLGDRGGKQAGRQAPGGAVPLFEDRLVCRV